MDNSDIVKELRSLCQLDIDAIHAYNECLNHIDISDIKRDIEKFRADHERHVKDLSALIHSFKEKAPDFTPDLKGYMLDVFSKLRSLTGTEGALKSLRGGENLTNKRYAMPDKNPLPRGGRGFLFYSMSFLYTNQLHPETPEKP
ncbi:MAG: DUF2383 domain-containing protein [Deltaproteobacteria bacterium]|nr:DUF2383 domain-containing protein [Deltaproteobacteria bacterium]